jgi:hypothetical protein
MVVPDELLDQRDHFRERERLLHICELKTLNLVTYVEITGHHDNRYIGGGRHLRCLYPGAADEP